MTRAGAELLAEAEDIVDRLSSLQEKALALATYTDFNIRILSNSYCPLENVYPLFDELTREFPKCHLVLDIAAPCAFDTEFQSGGYWFAISTLPTTRDLQNIVMTEPIGWIEFAYVVAAGHRMVNEFSISQRALSRYRQLAVTGTCDNQIKPVSSQLWSMNDLSSILSLVEKGFGWAVLPKQLVNRGIKNGALVQITSSEITAAARMAYGAFWKRSTPTTPVTEFFLKRFLSSVPRLGLSMPLAGFAL